MNSNSHTVNLEVTHLFHALKWVEWKEEDLPPAKKPVKCLIVGKDTFGFYDRLSFVFAESGTGIAGRPIDFVRLGSLDEALELAKTDKTVMLLVALETVAEEWDPLFFQSVRGSRLRSKRQILEKRRDVFLTFDPQPGQAFGQPPKSSLLRLDSQFKIARVQKDIHRGQWNGFRSLGTVILIIPKMPWERRFPFHSLRSRMKPST